MPWRIRAAACSGACRRPSLDPAHAGARVVTLDLHVPLVADYGGRDPHLRIGLVHAGEGGRVDLFPDLAVVQGPTAPVGEAAELADDPGDDGIGFAEAHEATILGFDLFLRLGR